MESDYELEFLKQRHAAIKKQYQPDCQKSPYINEIVVYMKKTEMERIKKLNQSPQISWRSYLVDWIFIVATELKIGHNTIHLAIKLLDGFMSGHDIEARRLDLVSIGCLRIASKFEEKDSKVPRLKSICALHPDNINIRPEEYRCLEEMVLKYFKWNVNIPTTSHFLEIFLPYSYDIEIEDLNVFQNNYGGYVPNCSEILKEKLFDIVRAFRDVSLKERSLMSKLPSRVASAIIYCSRQICHLHPAWSEELKHTTGLLKYQFEDCIAILNQIYNIALRNPNKKKRQADLYEEQSPNVRNPERDPVKSKKQNQRSKSRLRKVLSDGSTVPIIDLDEDSSDINDDSSDVEVIEISPDNGYSSMGSSGSSDAYKSETSITDEKLMCKDDKNRNENKSKDLCNSPRLRKKSKTDIEKRTATSPDYPWYLRTNTFKKNSCATKSVQTFKSENCRTKEYSNCRRHLKFDKDENTEAFKKGSDPTKDTSSTRSQTSLPGHLQNDMNNEVLILMEKICNKSEYSQNGGQNISAIGSDMF